MKTVYFSVVALLFLTSCSKEEVVNSYLESLSSDKYFSEEVLTDSSENLYGVWKAFGTYGGWSGFSKPDFDYLEIKPFGIYGLIRNDTLFEYGKILSYTFDSLRYNMGHQIKLEPEYKLGQYYRFEGNSYFSVQNDTLFIGDGFIDGVSIGLRRSK